MRQVVLLLSFLLSNLVFSQDVIIKKNGDEINAKIIELTSEQVKYKEFDFQEGPTRNINKSEVFMVIYANGKREKFSISDNNSNKTMEESLDKSSSKSGFYREKKLSLSLIAGSSVGNGIGLEFQYISPKSGFGFHIGGGYGIAMDSDGSYIGWNAGVIYFISKSFYIDGQFGTLQSDVDYDWDSDTQYESTMTIGPSLLAGFEWVFWKNKKVDIGLNIGAGASYSINGYENDIYFAYDVGSFFRF